MCASVSVARGAARCSLPSPRPPVCGGKQDVAPNNCALGLLAPAHKVWCPAHKCEWAAPLLHESQCFYRPQSARRRVRCNVPAALQSGASAESLQGQLCLLVFLCYFVRPRQAIVSRISAVVDLPKPQMRGTPRSSPKRAGHWAPSLWRAAPRRNARQLGRTLREATPQPSLRCKPSHPGSPQASLRYTIGRWYSR